MANLRSAASPWTSAAAHRSPPRRLRVDRDGEGFDGTLRPDDHEEALLEVLQPDAPFALDEVARMLLDPDVTALVPLDVSGDAPPAALELLRSDRNATGYAGVCHTNRGEKPFQAALQHCGRTVRLGVYETAEEAARVYTSLLRRARCERCDNPCESCAALRRERDTARRERDSMRAERDALLVRVEELKRQQRAPSGTAPAALEEAAPAGAKRKASPSQAARQCHRQWKYRNKSATLKLDELTTRCSITVLEKIARSGQLAGGKKVTVKTATGWRDKDVIVTELRSLWPPGVPMITVTPPEPNK